MAETPEMLNETESHRGFYGPIRMRDFVPPKKIFKPVISPANSHESPIKDNLTSSEVF